MITIICGEDIASSRQFYTELISKYKGMDNDIKSILPEELKYLINSYEEKGLFGSKTIYTIENLNKHFTRNKKALNKLLDELSTKKDLVLIAWENFISKRDMNITANVTIKEFKPNQNIFKLLESCYPSNLKTFLSILEQIKPTTEDFFIYIMLSRHIRKLLLYQAGIVPKNLQSWQEYKLKNQINYWEDKNILDFYDKLINIDYLIKSGTSPIKIYDYIDTLCTYYL